MVESNRKMTGFLIRKYPLQFVCDWLFNIHTFTTEPNRIKKKHKKMHTHQNSLLTQNYFRANSPKTIPFAASNVCIRERECIEFSSSAVSSSKSLCAKFSLLLASIECDGLHVCACVCVLVNTSCSLLRHRCSSLHSLRILCCARAQHRNQQTKIAHSTCTSNKY